MIDTVLNKECIKQLKEYFAGARQKFDFPHFSNWNRLSTKSME
jgi:hypothetical protein